MENKCSVQILVTYEGGGGGEGSLPFDTFERLKLNNRPISMY